MTLIQPEKKHRKDSAHQQPWRLVRPETLWVVLRNTVLTTVSVLCYANSLHGELVHDDMWAVVNNPDVRAGSSVLNIFSNDFWGKKMWDNASHKSYRPLSILTFKLNILLGGLTPLYFHIVNVCLHCAVTCLLMHTCHRCVFKDSRLAFITALLFAVHPVHTEAVSGVVGRADVLASLLFLMAFLAYTRSVDVCLSKDSLPSTVSVWSLFFSLLLGTCAMLVKETGITVFGVCVFYDTLWFSIIFCHAPPWGQKCFHVPFLFLSTLCRTLTYSYLLSFNAWLLLAPIVLCYDWQVGSIPLVESVVDLRNLATMLMAVLMVSFREVLMGLLFLVFPFIPASNLFFRVGFVVAERILYMPSMGYCILVAYGFSKLCSMVGRWGNAVLTAFMLLLLLLFSLKTIQQNYVWVSREALFRSGIQTLPHNAKVHYNYGNFLKDSGRHDEAIHHYNTALRLYPRHASALNNLGTLTHSPEEAEKYYRRALDTNPQHNRALFNLGNLLKMQGKEKEAETLLMDSIRFGPHFADAYSSLASLYIEQKRLAEADELYLKGIKNCPDNSDLHNNYGVFLADTGQLKEKTIYHYQQAVQLKPSHYVAMVNLGRLLRASNDNKAAEYWYKRALQVTRKVDILTPLGALYYNTGRYEEALQVYREAAALQSDSIDIWLALVQVLVMAGYTDDAEKMTLDIISREGSCIECYRLLSAIYRKGGNLTQALEALDRALQLNPTDTAVRAELHFSKGNHLREMNQLDQAFESYKLAVELNPDQAQAWMNMGGIKHIEGDFAAARQYYQQALQLSPDSTLLKENLDSTTKTTPYWV
uniref:dolichyl-phosphate-mannose--protein mannosyltransferase n=1 Tax=Cynoglossus semilaevis TaxID=244447 RepID=A0A3P8URY2_CYNSE